MRFLRTGPGDAPATLLLAHGAGAAMDTRFMNAIAEELAGRGLAVARFEFAYMAARRTGDGRRPPPRAERLNGEFVNAIGELGAVGPLFIGGKSMGGRVASMVADDLFRDGRIAGLVCLGYPFHPPATPDRLRTAHLETLRAPALICQGTRDPFGTRDEVAAYPLSAAISLHWLEDGDHDFRTPRGAARSGADNLSRAAERIAAWIGTITHQARGE